MALMVQVKQRTALPCIMKVKNEQCEVLIKPLAFSLCDGEGSELLQHG